MDNKAKSGALTFIFITLIIDVIGLGIIIPVIPKLLQTMIGGDLSQASKYSGWLSFAYAGMQFLFSPIVGGLSDRFGRRPVLLISLLGFGIDYLFMGFAPTIWWFFIGRLIAGVTGASFTTATAYIADVSPPEKRAQNFGLIGVAFGVGFIVGPVLGGLLGQFGVRIPFYASAILALLNAIYGYFVLPESLPVENRRKFDWKRANPAGSLSRIAKYPVILSLTASLLCIYLAGQANQSTWTFITIAKFGWDEKMVGYSLGFIGLMIAIVQGGLIRVVIPAIGQKRSIYFGLALYTIGFLLFAFVTQTWMMFVAIIPFSLGGICGPALQGVISGQVAPNEQGEIQGSLTSLISLTSIIGPLLMNNLFSYFTAKTTAIYFPGAPFLMGAFLSLLSVLFAMKSLAKFSRHEKIG